MNFTEAQDMLVGRFASSSRPLYDGDKGFNLSVAWMEYLGNPQENYPSVHIAGTSGKGSVTYLLSAILKQAGLSIGSITSPHIIDIRERMIINGLYMDEKDFVDRVRGACDDVDGFLRSGWKTPNYFEVLTGMAYCYFNDAKVDYGVVETGVGGLYDSTNTIKRSDKLAVITRLGLDHTHILGDNLVDIATQKAGIIPLGGHVIVLEPDDADVKKRILEVANERGSSVQFVDPWAYDCNFKQSIDGIYFDYISDGLSLRSLGMSLLGEYQVGNASLAIASAEYLSKRDDLDIDGDSIRRALSGVVIPARAEVFKIRGRLVIVDGAHNQQKLHSLMDMIDSLDLPEMPIAVFGVKKGKDIQAMSTTIARSTSGVLITVFFADRFDVLATFAANSNDILSYINDAGGNAMACASPIEALDIALSQSVQGQVILVTGSMYMIGELYGYIQTIKD